MREDVVRRLMALFEGMSGAYGTYAIVSQKENGKRVGDDRTIKTLRQPVTLEVWQAHCCGKSGLGIIPIREDSTCRFGAIDVDVYKDFDIVALVKRIQKLGLPLVVCRSKSGGAHIYIFTQAPVPAAKLIKRLRDIAALLGFGHSEIFPKQDKILIERGDIGQWINMPYFGNLQGLRYGIKADGDAMEIEEFLEAAELAAVDESYFDQPFDLVNDFEDGPPCLAHLIQIGFPDGTRNNGLFNIGVYLRKKFQDEWEDKLNDYNHLYMTPPLKAAEVQGVIKSLNKKSYRYKCEDQPINAHCNRQLCKTKKFGIADGSVVMPSFGTLTKLDVSPTIWFWDVDGSRVELTTEQLQNPLLFQRACMESLNMVVPAVPKAAWQAVLQQAFTNLIVIEGTVDSTPEGMFMEILEKFCSSRAVGSRKEELLLGKAVVTGGRAYFRMIDLAAYLERVKFREFKPNKIAAVLRGIKAEHHFDVINGRGVNHWSVPEFAKQTKPLPMPDEVRSSEDVF